MIIKFEKFRIVLIMFLLFNFISAKTIRLAAVENEPYIGNNLKDKGYVYKMVDEIFKSAGYEVIIDFFPLNRAKAKVENGEYDAMFPFYFNESDKNRFIFSESFDGTSVGLLKKKSLNIKLKTNKDRSPYSLLLELKKYKFGIRNGQQILTEIEIDKELKKEMVLNDSQNILKLELGRIDFAMIDRYTASDFLVREAPQLIGKLEFLDGFSVKKDFYLAFFNSGGAIRDKVKAFNDGLKNMKKTGKYEELLAEYGIFLPKQNKSGKTKLTIGIVDNKDMLIMKKNSKIYEKKYPNIELDWKVLDEEVLRKRTLADMAISAGEFDILMIGSYEVPIWAKQNWILPINNIPKSYDISDLLKPIKDSITYNRKIYALPFYGESSILYYRKDLFEAKGIKMPKNPTYDEILKFAKILNNPQNGVYGIGLRAKPGWGANMAYISTLVHSYGGQWFDMKWNPMLDTPEWEKALDMYRELVIRYGPPNPTQNSFNELLKLFSEGHLAMWVDATVAAGVLFNPNESSIVNKTAFTSAPIGNTERGSKWLWSWNLAVPTSSDNSKEAIKFITWATSKEYTNLVAQNEGWVAVPSGVRISTYKNSNYRKVAPFSDYVLETIQSVNLKNNTLKLSPYRSIRYVAIPEFSSIGDKVGTNISNMIEGKISVVDVLKNSQKEIESQMKKSGYIK